MRRWSDSSHQPHTVASCPHFVSRKEKDICTNVFGILGRIPTLQTDTWMTGLFSSQTAIIYTSWLTWASHYLLPTGCLRKALAGRTRAGDSLSPFAGSPSINLHRSYPRAVNAESQAQEIFVSPTTDARIYVPADPSSPHLSLRRRRDAYHQRAA